MNGTKKNARPLPDRPGLVGLIAAGVVLVFFVAMAWHRRWISDDGLINVRIAQNLLDGHGPVFNVSERVEAYTSPLWLFLIALFGLVGFRLEHAAVFSGLALSVAGAGLVVAGARKLHCALNRIEPHQTASRPLLPIGIGVYAALPVAWDYATSGLETGLSMAWLGLSFFGIAGVVATRPDTVQSAGSDSDRAALPSRLDVVAFVVGLGGVIRPELLVFTCGYCVPLFVISRGIYGTRWKKKIARLAVIMCALPVTYQIFRMGYFAALVPNTALAKEAFTARWGQGWRYAGNFFGLYYLWIPLAAVALLLWDAVRGALGKNRPGIAAVLLCPVLCGVVYFAYVIRVGGDFMHGRLFLPPLFGMLAPTAVFPARIGRNSDKGRPVLSAVACAVVAIWAIACAAAVRVPAQNVSGIGDERGWYSRRGRGGHPVAVEDYAEFDFYRKAQKLKAAASAACGRDSDTDAEPRVKCEPFVLLDLNRFQPGEAGRGHVPVRPGILSEEIVMVSLQGAMGIVGTVLGSRVHLVDYFGLTDPIGARLELTRRRRPGHEKRFSRAWVTGRYGHPDLAKSPGAAAARAAMDCPPLKELQEATSQPLTLSRFLKNLWAAVRFHNLRIPADPVAAKRRFCPGNS